MVSIAAAVPDKPTAPAFGVDVSAIHDAHAERPAGLMRAASRAA